MAIITERVKGSVLNERHRKYNENAGVTRDERGKIIASYTAALMSTDYDSDAYFTIIDMTQATQEEQSGFMAERAKDRAPNIFKRTIDRIFGAPWDW